MASPSSAAQPAKEYPDVVNSSPECHTPDYPDTSISILESIGELHHHFEPIIAYNEPFIDSRPFPPKVRHPNSPRPMRARSAEQPADYNRTAFATGIPWLPRFPRSRCQATWLHIFSGIGLHIGPHPVYPARLQEAIRAYDDSPYWPTPTVKARMALSGEVVCTLGPEFSMLGVCYFSRVIDAERYVSSVLQWPVKIAFIGSIRAPKSDWKIAEMLLREKTNTIVFQAVPM